MNTDSLLQTNKLDDTSPTFDAHTSQADANRPGVSTRKELSEKSRLGSNEHRRTIHNDRSSKSKKSKASPLTTISSGGPKGSSKEPQCYNCGERGHLAKQCAANN